MQFPLWSYRFNEFVQQEKERSKKRGSPTLARKISEVNAPTNADYIEEVRHGRLKHLTRH